MGKGLGVLRAGSGSSGKIVGCAVADDVGSEGKGKEQDKGQVLVVREGMFVGIVLDAGLIKVVGTGVFVASDGTLARDTGIAWPSPPEDIGNVLPPFPNGVSANSCS